MFVGVLKLTFSIPGARSLKDKRSIVRSFKDRVQARFKVSAAEVGSLDHHQHATLGVSVVSNEAAHCDEVLSQIASLASTHRDAILLDRCMEIIPFGESGKSIQNMFETNDRLKQGLIE